MDRLEAPPGTREFVYREGNVFRLKERRGDLWVWEVGIWGRGEDQDWKIASERPPHTLEPMEPGHLYWLLEIELSPDHLAVEIISIAEAGGQLTATTTELYQDLEAQIKALGVESFSTSGDSRRLRLTPEGLEMVRSALRPPGEEWDRSALPQRRRSPKVTPVLQNGFAVIPSSAPLETLLQGIQDAAEGAHSWGDFENTTVPTYRRLMGRGGKDGTIDLSVRLQDGEVLARDAMLSTLWDQVRELDDLTGDVLLAAFTQWLTRQEAGSTWITADAILDYRGIKPITKREGNSRRRAGHHWEHKAAIARAFEQLDHLWLNIDNVEVIELEGKRRRPKKLHLESKAIAISDRISQGGLGGGQLPIAWHYRPGEWARPFLQEGFRQTALLAQQSLHYDPYRETWEKRLSRYFAFHWRIQAHQGNYSQPYRVDTLLKAIAIEPNKRFPQRTRERLEKALDRLQADKVVANWEYRKGDEEALPTKGWLPSWLSWTVEVMPPLDVINHYARITEASPKTRAALVN